MKFLFVSTNAKETFVASYFRSFVSCSEKNWLVGCLYSLQTIVFPCGSMSLENGPGSGMLSNAPSSKLRMSATGMDVTRQTISETAATDIDELSTQVENNEPGAAFRLGQIFFIQKKFEDSRKYLEKTPDGDYRAQFLYATLMFDGLGGFADDENVKVEAVKIMEKVASLNVPNDPFIFAAAYNVGCAHYLNTGVKNSTQEAAEKWWIKAADDGNPNASIRAQSSLGMFYCRPGHSNLKKAFFWHSEAVGNGSLESQGFYFYF